MQAAMKPAEARPIPYVDLAAQHAPLKAELLAAVERVIDRGDFILGTEVAAFEARFAALCGTKYAVSVANGTDALVLALRALGIGPGDEVITAPNSFIASASAIALVGATPIFADVADDLNLDPERVRAAVTPRTKAILPVHLTGRAAPMESIAALAAEYHLAIVEDCAQAVLAERGGRRVGSFGALGCFSLHPLKTLNACGDGGVITTDDPTLHDRLTVARNLGLRSRADCEVWSGNSRLDTMQAAILLVKLGYLPAWTEARRANARVYQELLAVIPEVLVPRDRPGERAVYHTFVIQAEQRDALAAHLHAAGIGTSIHYPVPIHLQRAAAGLGLGPGSYPVCEAQAERILSLPIYPGLTRADLERVAWEIRRFYRI